MNLFEYLSSAFRGTSRAREEHLRAVSSTPGIPSGLSELRKLCSETASEDNEAPIFLLAAGWRSGSTFLQRLIMSDSRVLLWGEPYDECGLIQALAGTVRAFRSGWPPQEYYYTGAKPEQLAGEWIANLFPTPSALRDGHRAFFDTTLAAPARAAGASRWGIKEVRLDADHAHYLRWLYPRARFVFLYRNPLDAYQSYCRYGRNWYDTWPDKPVFTPTAFGNHWRRLTEGFLREAKPLDGLIVRYEELANGKSEVRRSIEDYLDVRFDAAALGKKVGSSERRGEKAWVSRLEARLLQRAVSPLAENLGYTW